MKIRRIFYFLMFLPLIVSSISLPFLSEVIPAHYGINNVIDRWGSKYEILIFPLVTVLFGGFLLLMVRISKKQEKNGNNNEKIGLVIGISSLLIFNIISAIIIYSSLKRG